MQNCQLSLYFHWPLEILYEVTEKVFKKIWLQMFWKLGNLANTNINLSRIISGQNNVTKNLSNRENM